MSARPAVRAVLVDLDGTLLDTAPDIAAAANAMLADLALGSVPLEAVRDFIGQGIGNLVRRCLERAAGRAPEPALLDAALERFAEHYARENGRGAKAYPSVREGLTAMRADGLRLACVTNKASRFSAPLLERAGLAGYFEALVCADVVGKRKPDPALFREACAQLGAAPAESVVIGDSANDAQGGRAAGCRVLLVPYGYREGMDVRAIASDGIVGTLLEAARVLSAQS
ncbi:MAG: phosphoglycolate phosphatase [Betaproteobacteria bacterium]|nr:phosphoglycolate phosphatase [Betaproteobacteria bacterium]